MEETNQEVTEIDFEDTDAFYQRLTKLVKAGKRTLVRTPFTSAQQLPPRLVKTFQIGTPQIAAISNQAAGQFIPGASAPAGLNVKYLIILGSALVGGALGWFAGPLGAAIGAGVGTAIGCVTVAVVSRSHTVTLQVGPKGNLNIRLQPVP